MEIRQQLIKARKQRKISVQTLSKWCGVSASLLYAYEKGKTNLGEDNINKIAELLDMKILLIDKEILE